MGRSSAMGVTAMIGFGEALVKMLVASLGDADYACVASYASDAMHWVESAVRKWPMLGSSSTNRV